MFSRSLFYLFLWLSCLCVSLFFLICVFLFSLAFVYELPVLIVYELLWLCFCVFLGVFYEFCVIVFSWLFLSFVVLNFVFWISSFVIFHLFLKLLLSVCLWVSCLFHVFLILLLSWFSLFSSYKCNVHSPFDEVNSILRYGKNILNKYQGKANI